MVITAVIKSKFSFLGVAIRHMFLNTFHLAQSQLGVGPERFNAINVGLVIRKFIRAVFFSKMFCIANINKLMIATPATGMNDAIKSAYLKGLLTPCSVDFLASGTISV